MYLVVHFVEPNDGSAASETFTFSDLASAKEKYHSLLAYDYNASVISNLNHFYVVILDHDGVPVERSDWTYGILHSLGSGY